ncbi:MAG: HAD family hydrolase [Ruminococcaceae bacterium]|nr:HAD family hydrolase [Oscillospiraceae bacterium]
MHISGAIFDMDGTLIDSLMLWDILWEDFSRRFCQGQPFRPSAETDKAIRTLPLKEAMYLLHEVYGLGQDGESVYQAATEVFLDFYRTRVTLKAGVREFLDHCAHTGVKMVVATASDPVQVHAALNHCGIEHHISALVTCSEVGVGKHEPAVYEKALEILGTSKEETWVFEDSCVGLTTAHKAGFHTVGIYDAYNFGQDTIQSLADIYIAPGEDMTKCLN